MTHSKNKSGHVYRLLFWDSKGDGAWRHAYVILERHSDRNFDLIFKTFHFNSSHLGKLEEVCWKGELGNWNSTERNPHPFTDTDAVFVADLR